MRARARYVREVLRFLEDVETRAERGWIFRGDDFDRLLDRLIRETRRRLRREEDLLSKWKHCRNSGRAPEADPEAKAG